MENNAVSDPIKEEVRQKFIEYLEFHQQRKTPERFAILDEIYSNKEHFDVSYCKRPDMNDDTHNKVVGKFKNELKQNIGL
jgi:hypothetical protein